MLRRLALLLLPLPLLLAADGSLAATFLINSTRDDPSLFPFTMVGRLADFDLL